MIYPFGDDDDEQAMDQQADEIIAERRLAEAEGHLRWCWDQDRAHSPLKRVERLVREIQRVYLAGPDDNFDEYTLRLWTAVGEFGPGWTLRILGRWVEEELG